MGRLDPFSCTGPVQAVEHAVYNTGRDDWSAISVRGAESSLVARTISTLNPSPQCVNEVERPPEHTTLCHPPSACTLLKEEVNSHGEQCALPQNMAITGATAGLQGSDDMVTRLGCQVASPCLSDTALVLACQLPPDTCTIAAFDSCEPVLVEQQPLPASSFLSDFAVSAQELSCAPTFPSYHPYATDAHNHPVVKLEDASFQSNPVTVTGWSSTLGAFDSCPQLTSQLARTFDTDNSAIATTMGRTTGAWGDEWCSFVNSTDSVIDFWASSPYMVAMAAPTVLPTVSQVPLRSPQCPQCPAMALGQQDSTFAIKDDAQVSNQPGQGQPHPATPSNIHGTWLGHLASSSTYHTWSESQPAHTALWATATDPAQVSMSTLAPTALLPGSELIARPRKRKNRTTSSSLHCHYPGCDKRFSSMHNLNEHRQVHVFPRVRSYLCGIGGCSNRYFYKRDMERHRRKKHDCPSHLQVGKGRAKPKDSAHKRFSAVRTRYKAPATGA